MRSVSTVAVKSDASCERSELLALSVRPSVCLSHSPALAACGGFADVGAAGSSGITRNFRQGVRQSVAFLSVHSRSAALPSRPYSQKTS